MRPTVSLGQVMATATLIATEAVLLHQHHLLEDDEGAMLGLPHGLLQGLQRPLLRLRHLLIIHPCLRLTVSHHLLTSSRG